MTVRELKEKLKGFDNNLEVYLDCDSHNNANLSDVELACGDKHGENICQVKYMTEEKINKYRNDGMNPTYYCYLYGS